MLHCANTLEKLFVVSETVTRLEFYIRIEHYLFYFEYILMVNDHDLCGTGILLLHRKNLVSYQVCS